MHRLSGDGASEDLAHRRIAQARAHVALEAGLHKSQRGCIDKTPEELAFLQRYA